MCQAEIRVEDVDVPDAIIDTGAPNTTMSYTTARKMGLFNYMRNSDIIFTTAGGTTEKSMGFLKDLKLGIGDLMKPMDVRVAEADTYSILVGYDLLKTIGGSIDTEIWLWYRTGPCTRDRIRLHTSGGSRAAANVLQE